MGCAFPQSISARCVRTRVSHSFRVFGDVHVCELRARARTARGVADGAWLRLFRVPCHPFSPRRLRARPPVDLARGQHFGFRSPWPGLDCLCCYCPICLRFWRAWCWSRWARSSRRRRYQVRQPRGNDRAWSGQRHTPRASYYLGGLVGSATLGVVFDKFGWTQTVVALGIALVIAALVTFQIKEPAFTAAKGG